MELLLSVSVVLCSIFWVSGSPDLGDSLSALCLKELSYSIVGVVIHLRCLVRGDSVLIQKSASRVLLFMSPSLSSFFLNPSGLASRELQSFFFVNPPPRSARVIFSSDSFFSFPSGQRD
jgi:hypothetical protein